MSLSHNKWVFSDAQSASKPQLLKIEHLGKLGLVTARLTAVRHRAPIIPNLSMLPAFDLTLGMPRADGGP